MIFERQFQNPKNGGAKPMGQDGRPDYKFNNIAAQAASTIVHCQFLSFCNYLIDNLPKEDIP
jgi:hypothetical protein